jgi:hypothetical protein
MKRRDKKRSKTKYEFEFEVLTKDIFVRKKDATINAYIKITSHDEESAVKRLHQVYKNSSMPVYSYKVLSKKSL